MIKNIILLTIAVFYVVMLSPNDAYAALACKSGSFVKCSRADKQGGCVKGDSWYNTKACSDNGISCVSPGCDNGCEIANNCVLADGSDGGSSCPAECRANSCGTGYQDASGCGPITAAKPNFGCRADQACCKANSCGGGGGGGTVDDIRGYQDAATCNATWGWACDGYDLYGNNITVEIWMDGLQGTGLLLGSVVADDPGEWAIAGLCGGENPDRRFTFNLPESVRDGNGHLIYALAKNIGPGQDEVLGNSPVSVQCPPPYQVSGTVYNDPGATCSTAQGQNVGGALSVKWGSLTGSVASNGTFSLTPSSSTTNTLELVGAPPNGYVCTPSCGTCPNKSGVGSLSIGNNFFLTTSRSAWWQAAGAGVYAGSATANPSIRSLLPTTSTRLLVTNGSSSVGALIKASSSAPSLGNGTQISDTQWSAKSVYKGKTMNYGFFAGHIGVISSTANDWLTNELTQPVAGKDFYYLKPSGGTATITSDWTLAGSDSYVIFVDGDLRIEGNITVPVGNFLAFIVKGDVIVDPAISDIAGLLVMDGDFVTESQAPVDDVPLTAQGSVVTWSGVSLQRDLGDTNITTPAEKFVYRPDLLINMPENMKTFLLNWQEVAPGSFQ